MPTLDLKAINTDFAKIAVSRRKYNSISGLGSAPGTQISPKPRKAMMLEKLKAIDDQRQRPKDRLDTLEPREQAITLIDKLEVDSIPAAASMGVIPAEPVDVLNELRQQIALELMNIEDAQQLETVLKFCQRPDLFKRVKEKADILQEILKDGHKMTETNLLAELNKKVEDIENKITSDLNFKNVFISPFNLAVGELNVY